MKKIIFLVLLSASIFISCKSSKPKDLIVNKWRIIDVSVPGMTMPDSIKNQLMQGTMEFTKDGKLLLSGMGNDQSGTYTISDDGKTLTVVSNGRTETNKIDELTKSKLVITDNTNGSKLSATTR